MKVVASALIVLAVSPALAQTPAELDENYKICRGHWVNHPVTVGGKTVTVLGYEPGWERCGDIEQKFYTTTQQAAKAKAANDAAATEAERKKMLDLANKVAPPTPPPAR